MKRIGIGHFKKLVQQAGVPEYMVLQTVRTTLDATRTAWAEHGKRYDLPVEIRNSIQQHMDAVAIGD
jgi:hypothetical protein